MSTKEYCLLYNIRLHFPSIPWPFFWRCPALLPLRHRILILGFVPIFCNSQWDRILILWYSSQGLSNPYSTLETEVRFSFMAIQRRIFLFKITTTTKTPLFYQDFPPSPPIETFREKKKNCYLLSFWTIIPPQNATIQQCTIKSILWEFSLSFYSFLFFFFMWKGPQDKLASSSLWGLPWSFCLRPLKAGMTGMCHHTPFLSELF